MPLQRHFVGWDEPLTVKVRKFLLPGPVKGPTDLGDTLIVVPTRHAGRKLREAMALFCAQQGSALLSVRTITPAALFRSDSGTVPIADETAVKAAWACTLGELDARAYGALFPAGVGDRGPAWVWRTGALLQRLRETLSDGGYGIGAVPAACEGVMEELERWQDLGRLERVYLDRLAAMGWRDPCAAKIEQASQPELPPEVRRAVVAAVPDPALLMIRALERIARDLPVDVLVGAPPEWAEAFDAWGRPQPERWRGMVIEVPERNVLLAANPEAQGRQVLAEIAADSARMGPADLAVGVPDRRVIPAIEEALEAHGIAAFDPADRPLSEHPIYQLVAAWCALMLDRSYRSLSAFLRNADVLTHLARGAAAADEPRRLLAELDEFQNRYLPNGWAELARRFEADAEGGAAPASALAHAVSFTAGQVRQFETLPLARAVRAFLETVFEGSSVDPRSAEGAAFTQAARQIEEALDELEAPRLAGLKFDCAQQARLLLARLEEAAYAREREDALVDLVGWLELPWCDAPFLYVTGMNEGIVPDTRLADPFLPDSLRARLKLRDDAARLARDAFLMRLLVESRRAKGRVCFIAGKTSAEGDPLRPSRLLFRCADAELPARASRLFGPAEERRPMHPATVSFKLNPWLPNPAGADPIARRGLHVTAFRDYLVCPFRFYLKHVLGMQTLDDAKVGPDAADFGTLVHEVLQSLEKRDDMRECDDPGALAGFFAAQAEQWVGKRYGPAWSLPVTLALDAARQRLSKVAEIQSELRREGWEPICFELKCEIELGGLRVSGKIDRVDRHRESGRLRVIDYKTADHAADPCKAHLAPARPDTPAYALTAVGKGASRWVDLQLPLYRVLLAGRPELDGPLELAYFNIPKAVGDTGIAVWENFTSELGASAQVCAEAVVRGVRGGVFWPPASRVPYEEFAGLFFGEMADYFEPMP